MFINPFSLGNLPQDPKFKIFCTRVHTITLNTVTKYKLYPYIQTSLNQFIISKNLEKWLSLTVHQPFFPKLPQDPKFKRFFATNTIIAITSCIKFISKKLWKMTKSHVHEPNFAHFSVPFCPGNLPQCDQIKLFFQYILSIMLVPNFKSLCKPFSLGNF